MGGRKGESYKDTENHTEAGTKHCGKIPKKEAESTKLCQLSVSHYQEEAERYCLSHLRPCIDY